MTLDSDDRMSPGERRIGATLAAIFGLRMLGLFLILPVFAVYAKTLPGGADLTLVGVALGAYGLTQAVLQGAFILAKATNGSQAARDTADHLIRYVRMLFNLSPEKEA